jgi:hypothetical protein
MQRVAEQRWPGGAAGRRGGAEPAAAAALAQLVRCLEAGQRRHGGDGDDDAVMTAPAQVCALKTLASSCSAASASAASSCGWLERLCCRGRAAGRP